LKFNNFQQDYCEISPKRQKIGENYEKSPKIGEISPKLQQLVICLRDFAKFCKTNFSIHSRGPSYSCKQPITVAGRISPSYGRGEFRRMSLAAHLIVIFLTILYLAFLKDI
jgi:hypothetical protein